MALNLAFGNVPLVIFAAFVVSVVADAAKPVILDVAIEPANIVLVTEPVSPVVTTVPDVAGKTIVVVPAVAVASNLTVPDVAPARIKSLPAANAISSDDVQAPVAFTQLKVLSVVPLRVIPPPSAVAFDGLAIEPNSIFLSSTVSVVELTVVVVPLTVKSPVTVKLPPIDPLPVVVTAANVGEAVVAIS